MAQRLVVEIIGDASSLQHEFRKAAGETEGFGRKMAKLGKIAAVGAAGVAVAAVEIGKTFVEAAMTAQEQTDKLNKAFQNQGLSAEKLAPMVNKVEAANRKLGFSNSDTRESLAKLATAGDTVTAMHKDLALSTDLARFKNISLADATTTLVRAHAGNLRALKALGITIQPVTTAMDALKEAHKKAKTPITEVEKALAKQKDAATTYEAVVTHLTKAIGGQAQTFSDSAAGGMAQFHAQLGNLEETLGKKLLPVVARGIRLLDDLLGIFTGSGSASDKFKAALERLGIQGKTAAEIVKDLGVTFKILEKVVVTVFQVMGPIVKAFFGMLSAELQFLDDLIHGRWAKLWGDAAKIFSAVWKVIQATAGAEIKILGHIALRIGKAIVHGIVQGLADLGDLIWQAIKHGVESGVKKLAHLSLHIPLPHISLPHVHIPGTATGGIVTEPQIRLVGEAGPEAIIPLNQVQGFGGGVNINGPVHIHGVQDVRAFLRELQKIAGQNVATTRGRYGGRNLNLA